jgi:hypothetical protein
VEENHIEKYVSRLNPRIIHKAMCKQWLESKLLSKKLILTTEAAAQPNILSQLPPKNPSHHHPLSAPCPHPLQFPHPQPMPNPRDPDSMEINTVSQTRFSIMDAICNVCCACKLCFWCLKPIVPVTHTGNIKAAIINSF